MKVLIYGGSFDPVHKGHYSILKAACSYLKPDKVHIFTAYQSPFKNKSPRPFALRKQMAQEALSSIYSNIIFDDFELEQKRVVYTYETIKYVKKLYPGCQIYLLVGTDCLNDMPRWKNSEYIFQNSIIVAGIRKGVTFKTQDFKYILLKGDFPLISSTNIRLAILSNGLLPNSLLSTTEERIEKDLMYGLDLHKWLEAHLKPKRYLHVKLVAQASVELGRLYGANLEDCALAAVLHDSGKSMSNEELINYAIKNNLKVRDFKDICKFSPSLLHSEVSYHIAKNVFKIKNTEVLNAVRHHTLGRKNMSLLEQIIFISDMASKDRKIKDARIVKQAALTSLQAGVFAAMKVKLEWTIANSKWVAPTGIEFWNELCLKNN
ncbi:MAG: bis(5'-nucleosyl)-tetraphosphatase (symmetrical) YqeK [Elusimicrobiaceae bacterium]|nr:bis(5'-nucleosyl)-tetraphosphatase (symmetrical) YqeK [Elusimicrobiaceae bacterium]